MKKFENYRKNLVVLQRAEQENRDNEFIIGGIIDKFYIQFELGWKVLKELLRYEGRSEAATGSPREIIRTAYAIYDFLDERLWLSMLKERNNTAHIYDETAAKELVEKIIHDFVPEFTKMEQEIISRYGERGEPEEVE